ncbi:MAG: hypothetical protein H6839_05820 [Planctomycetes bacterium]|nr:hypothetical protein [Planctomycetota bacterium]
MRTAILLLALLTAAPLAFAQEEKKQVDLAVAFPSTTMVYLRADTNDYFDALNPEEIFAGLESDLDLPDLGEIARDRLELKLSDEEVSALARGVRVSAIGLLDVAVSGPKFEIVIRHQHLGALARALKQAQAEGASTVPGVEDYYGNLVYEIELPLPASAPRDDFSMDMNPFGGWMSNQAYWVSILNNEYLIIATSDNAVKDAVDYLSFPDDPIDTLLGNARYKEAVADFDKPQGLFFVNIQSVINTMERLTGDKGSSAGMFEMLTWQFGVSPEQVQFFVGLMQYEQFKSFAAGFWLDEKALTLRMDANLVFHNAPGWFNTVRIDPKPMPLTEFIPANSMLALTDCVDDVGGMYERVKSFFIERCKAAGQTELAQRWLDAEKELSDKKASLPETLGHLGGGQAVVVIPRATEDITDFNPTNFAFILGVKDRKAAEDFFYKRLIGSRMGEGFADPEGELAPVTCIDGVEIHHDESGQMAFAFVDGKELSAFVIGDLPGVKAVVSAQGAKSNLVSMPSWTAARQLLWEQGSAHVYVNVGAVLRSIGSFTSRAFLFDWGEEEKADFDRDDTEKDDDPVPFLSDFFKDTIVVGSARSNNSGVNVRLAAAGWPDRTRMRSMALHYRDVERNRQVRDDFVRLRDAARAQVAIKGKPAKEISELLESGVLVRKEWGVDPYGADDEGGADRDYKLAEVPDDVDIRQAIVCAYQRKPGLRGDYMVVLWNTHIVEMTPAQLEKAIELAKKGEPLPRDGDWYREPVNPLYKEKDPREVIYEEEWPDESKVTVEIIDDDGNESTVDIDVGTQDQQATLMRRTEDVLKAKDKETD